MKKVQTATPVEIPEEDRVVLDNWSRSFKVEHRLRQRARIVLKCAAGKASRAVARELGCTPGTASHWRVRYAREGLAGLKDLPRKGAKRVYTVETDRRILEKLNETPPSGYARWSAPLLS